MTTKEIWRLVPSVLVLLASSEGRLMVAPYTGGLPNGGSRQYGGEPTFGQWDGQRFIVLRGWKACADGYNWFIATFPAGVADYQDVLSALAVAGRPDDAQWLMDRVAGWSIEAGEGWACVAGLRVRVAPKSAETRGEQ